MQPSSAWFCNSPDLCSPQLFFLLYVDQVLYFRDSSLLFEKHNWPSEPLGTPLFKPLKRSFNFDTMLHLAELKALS
jgi:hypothetical protein